MTACPTPDQLASWFLGDLADAEALAIDAHVLECDACARGATTLAAVVQGVRTFTEAGSYTPLVTPEAWQRMRTDPRVGSHALSPGDSSRVPFPASLDFLVYRLRVPAGIEEALQLEVLDDRGQRLFATPAVPDGGEVRTACRRHWGIVLPRITFRLVGSSGATVAEYHTMHDLSRE